MFHWKRECNCINFLYSIFSYTEFFFSNQQIGNKDKVGKTKVSQNRHNVKSDQNVVKYCSFTTIISGKNTHVVT